MYNQFVIRVPGPLRERHVVRSDGGIGGRGLALLEDLLGLEDARLHLLPLLLLAVPELLRLRLRRGRRSRRTLRLRARGGGRALRDLPLRVVGVGYDAALAVEGQQRRRDAIEKVAVVGHQHQRAGELQQAFLEHLESRDVEIVRRLVEHEDVGRLQHQPRHQHARLLASGQAAHRRLELVGAEEESLRPPRDVNGPALEDHRVAARGGQGAQERQLRRQPRPMLIEDDDAQVGRAVDLALVRALEPGEHAQQRRLSAAVAAKQAEPHPGRQHEIEVAHDGPAAEALGHAFRGEQPLRLPIRPRERDAHAAALRAIVEVGQLADHPPRRVDARLRLARPRLRLP